MRRCEQTRIRDEPQGDCRVRRITHHRVTELQGWPHPAPSAKEELIPGTRVKLNRNKPSKYCVHASGRTTFCFGRGFKAGLFLSGETSLGTLAFNRMIAYAGIGRIGLRVGLACKRPASQSKACQPWPPAYQTLSLSPAPCLPWPAKSYLLTSMLEIAKRGATGKLFSRSSAGQGSFQKQDLDHYLANAKHKLQATPFSSSHRSISSESCPGWVQAFPMQRACKVQC